MMSNAAPALFAKEPKPKSRSHYKVFSKGEIGNIQTCKSIIEAHGGRIWAANNPEGGRDIFFDPTDRRSDQVMYY